MVLNIWANVEHVISSARARAAVRRSGFAHRTQNNAHNISFGIKIVLRFYRGNSFARRERKRGARAFLMRWRRDARARARGVPWRASGNNGGRRVRHGVINPDLNKTSHPRCAAQRWMMRLRHLSSCGASIYCGSWRRRGSDVSWVDQTMKALCAGIGDDGDGVIAGALRRDARISSIRRFQSSWRTLASFIVFMRSTSILASKRYIMP